MHYIKCFANWVYLSVPAGIRTGFAGLASRFSTLDHNNRLNMAYLTVWDVLTAGCDKEIWIIGQKMYQKWRIIF